MPTVPLLDLKAQFAQISAEVMPVIEQVCRSQQFILGPQVHAFEERAARYSGAAAGVGTSSGAEVITSPFTFFATAGTIARVGARPVFCDIDPATFNLSPTAVREFVDSECALHEGTLIHRATGGHVKAIMPVHLYGQAADMDPLMEIAKRCRLKVIEDAAQAIGTEDRRGARAGSIGDVGCFSFFPSKNLGAF